MNRFAQDIALGWRSQPGRVGLAFFAIALGCLALSLMTAVLAGLSERAARLLREFGGSAVALAPANPASEESGPPALTERTAAVAAALFPEGFVSQARYFTAPALDGGAPVAIVATDAHLARARGWRIAEGRFLDARDLRDRERNAVLTVSLARAWNARVGQSAQLGDTLFRVVGIVETGGGALADATDRAIIAPGERTVFVPLTVMPSWLGPNAASSDALDLIYVRFPDDLPFAAGRARLERALGDPALGGAPVAWIAPETILRGVRRARRALDAGVGGLALLSLALGGATLAGLLAGQAQERIGEIGLRRALGATRGDIAALFIAEGVALSLAAALAGAAAARLLARGLSNVPELPLATDYRLWLTPLAAAGALGLLASWLPARRAARRSPAEALRAE